MSTLRLITAEDLRRLRKRFGFTQKALAEKAGLSQSFISRIENKTVDPRLSTIKKIVDAISSTQKEKRTAKDVMHSPVITIDASDIIRRALDLMKKHGVSQLPVLDGDILVGSIQESTLINRLLISTNTVNFFSTKIRDIMDKSFDTVKPNTDVDIIVKLLAKGNTPILVIDENKVIGIITKIDVLTT